MSRKTEQRSTRPDLHKYPVRRNGVRSYLIDKAPSDVLDRALAKARSEGRSLRVVLIDFLREYAGDG